MTVRSSAPAVLAAVAAVALGGCGLGAGDTPQDVHLRISDGFGATVLRDDPRPRVRGEDTVMRLLSRNAKVRTSYGGGFVAEIDGRGDGEDADGTDRHWMYFVDGVLADKGAASVDVHGGDRIWWDRQNTRLAPVTAVVGSFPAPLARAAQPVDVTCARPRARACATARARLRAAGVATRVHGARVAPRGALRVLVGAWAALRSLRDAEPFAAGPRRSGIFAVPVADGLVPYDAGGRAGRVRRDWGLVAATRPPRRPVTWLVTGSGDAGAARAADALDAGALRGRLAVLVTGGATVALPTRSSSDPPLHRPRTTQAP